MNLDTAAVPQRVVAIGGGTGLPAVLRGLRVLVRRGVSASVTAVVTVSDDGPGVHPEDANRIFEAFYQGRRPQGGPVGGTGIGLSVVAECVQAHGGSVELLRHGEPGAHFRMRLPLRRAGDKRLRAVANA